MNRDEARQLLPIIQAFAEGKTVQCRLGISYAWEDIISNVNFLLHAHNYRIKPEPVWRAWKTDEGPSFFIARTKYTECQPFPWFACRKVANGSYRVGADPVNQFLTNEQLFNHYWMVAEDGTEHPCGIVEAQP